MPNKSESQCLISEMKCFECCFFFCHKRINAVKGLGCCLLKQIYISIACFVIVLDGYSLEVVQLLCWCLEYIWEDRFLDPTGILLLSLSTPLKDPYLQVLGEGVRSCYCGGWVSALTQWQNGRQLTFRQIISPADPGFKLATLHL